WAGGERRDGAGSSHLWHCWKEARRGLRGRSSRGNELALLTAWVGRKLLKYADSSGRLSTYWATMRGPLRVARLSAGSSSSSASALKQATPWSVAGPHAARSSACGQPRPSTGS